MLAWTLRSTFTLSILMPVLVTNCMVLWNEMWPSVAVSVINVLSIVSVVVILLK